MEFVIVAIVVGAAIYLTSASGKRRAAREVEAAQRQLEERRKRREKWRREAFEEMRATPPRRYAVDHAAMHRIESDAATMIRDIQRDSFLQDVATVAAGVCIGEIISDTLSLGSSDCNTSADTSPPSSDYTPSGDG